MSHPARHLVALAVLLGLSWLPRAHAQTIADYSRAQRAWLEATMSQSAARSAGAVASAPAAAASVPSNRLSPNSMPPRLAAPTLASTTLPAIQVSGVFKSDATAVAEVVVNATAYLLEQGQGVPGTSWHVDAVAVDRVVLGRRSAQVAADGEGTRKVFALPAMR